MVIGDSAPALSLARGSATVAYSDGLDPVAVTTSDPDGDAVTVDATGLPAGLGVSREPDGSYRISGNADDAVGVYDAIVTASDGALTAQTPLQITVERENATLGYTGDLLSSTGSPSGTDAPVHLQAHLVQDDDERPAT